MSWENERWNRTGANWEEEEDVSELARYHALNNDQDETLYRDNPDYRDAFDSVKETTMKITETRLRQIIRETCKKLLTEEMISGDFLAEAAYEAMNDGVKTLAKFVNWIREHYPDYVQGLSKRDISKEASFYWKAEKKDRKPYDKYDTPGWGRFD
tara:strand:+ start:143 stop:607 length:465 start_codon:yes stop_codon:yes gene_type:complete